MRIVLTVNFSPWSPYSGGGQRSTHNLATALVRRGHDVTVVYTRAPGERVEPPRSPPYRVAWAAFAGLRSRRQAPLRPLTAMSVARAVDRIARTGVDAVHGNGDEAALLGRVRDRHRFTLVMTPRFPDYPGALLQPGGPSRMQWLALAVAHGKYLALGHGLRAADWVSPTSASARAMVRQAFDLDPARLRVVPNGIAPELLAVARAPSLPDDAPLLFFGRLSRGKGVDTLVEALGRLRTAVPPTQVVGRGELLPALRARVAALGLRERVRFVEWLDAESLAARLARARLCVLPSREESFGNAIAEAMAVGCPVISTCVGSVPELVDAGRTGVLVPPDDPPALADAIDALLREPDRADALGRAARERVRARFTWDAVAASFEDLYRGRPS